MSIHQGLTCFQLDNEGERQEQIRDVLSEHGAVFIIDLERILLLDSKPGLAQPMCQSIFIDLLEVPVAQIAMEGEAGLPDQVAQLEYVIGWSHSVFTPFCVSCAFLRPI